MVVACFLILNAVCELGNRMFSSQLMFGSDFFMPISLLASFGFSLLLLFLEKKWSCHASWPQFFFYFLLFVGTVPTFKVQLEKLADKPEVRFLNDYDNIYVLCFFNFIKFIGLVALGTNEYFLSSHRHHVIPKLLGGFKRKAGYGICYTFHHVLSISRLPGWGWSVEVSNPLWLINNELMIKIAAEHEPMECYCSVPSQIFYSWMGGLVGKGYKNPLTFEDLPKAPPQLDVGQNAKV